VFCTNEHAASYFRKLFSKRVAEDIKVTYDSIDPIEIDRARAASFDRNKVLEDLGIPVSKFLVLAVGQFVDRKGRWTFLEAARLIKARTEEMAFVWVSPTIPEGENAKRVESFDLGDSFHLIRSDLLGTERLDILKFFRAADLFVLPSYVEGVPIALLEAMAIGLPCISTSVYGIPEAIINGKTGLLIEAGDAKALSESIMQLSNKLELRSQLADHGRHFVMTKFDERLAAATVVEAYCMVIHSEQ
jgi:glycosyltransferase involved in cell wall biosynthesis